MKEKKEVTLIKLSQNKKPPVVRKEGILNISANEDDFLGMGMEGVVTRVTVPVREGVSDGLAYKEFHSEGYAVHAFKTWMKLKAIGVPVPTTFRLVEEAGKYAGILMTDLTHGWRDVLITPNPTKQYVIERVNSVSPDTVQKLAAIDLKDPELARGIREKLEAIAETTAKNNIEFTGGDIVSAVFHNSGNFAIVLSDMFNIKTDSQQSYELLREQNLYALSTINVMISEAQRIAKEISRSAKRKSRRRI